MVGESPTASRKAAQIASDYPAGRYEKRKGTWIGAVQRGSEDPAREGRWSARGKREEKRF